MSITLRFHRFFFLFVWLCWCVSDLRYNPQRPPQAVKADVSDILPRYVDVPPLGLKEAEQQPHNGALPATRRGTNHQHYSACELHPHSLLMISDDKSAHTNEMTHTWLKVWQSVYIYERWPTLTRCHQLWPPSSQQALRRTLRLALSGPPGIQNRRPRSEWWPPVVRWLMAGRDPSPREKPSEGWYRRNGERGDGYRTATGRQGPAWCNVTPTPCKGV